MKSAKRNAPVAAHASSSAAIPTQERLIEAAIDEFAERGRMGARIESIARRAGVNKQLIYHYFGSKEGLYVAALERVYLRFRGDPERLDAAIAGVGAEQALRRLACYLFGQEAELFRFRRILQDADFHGLWNEANFGPIRDGFRILIDILREVLDRGAQEGVFRADIDPAELYISIAGACSIRLNNAHSLSYIFDIDIVSPEGAQQSQKIAIDNIVNGLKPHCGTRDDPYSRR